MAPRDGPKNGLVALYPASRQDATIAQSTAFAMATVGSDLNHTPHTNQRVQHAGYGTGLRVQSTTDSHQVDFTLILFQQMNELA